MTKRILAASMLASLSLAACESGQIDLSSAKQMTSSGEIGRLDAEGRDIAKLAARVLAEELDVPLSAVSVDTVRAVDWRDSSIGCPQPGEAYLQVITPGHKVTLRVDGKIHTVHEAQGRAFVCRQRKDPTQVTGQIDLVWGQMALAAREDLAAHLGVQPGEIRVAGARRTTFPNAALGCPEPGVDYPPGEREGFVLRLRHGGRDFTYHTDLERVLPCPAFSRD